MQLSKREIHLLELLIKNDMTLTAQELANYAHVSTKTIYRTIKKINEESSRGDLVISEVGKGFRLDYEKYLKETQDGKQETTDEALNRRNRVMLKLLFKSPNTISVKELFESYFVTDSVILKDSKKMAEFLQGYHLELQRKNNRFAIIGDEPDIRKAVNSLLGQTNLMNATFLANEENVNAYDVNYITSLLEYIEKRLETTINYPYNENIFSHLYILLKRSREGSISTEDDGLDQEEQQLIRTHQALYEVSEEVIRRVAGYLGNPLATIEAFYLFQYLISSRLENEDLQWIPTESEAMEVSCFFIRQMKQLLGIEIDTKEYQEDLLGHIAPLLYRLKHDIIVKNEMLSDILLEYPKTYHAVEQVAKLAEQQFKLAPISKDEIGFLVLYFVRYKEMKRRKQRVLIMCSSGVGTSELLKVKVRKSFPDIEIVDVLSAKKFQKYQEDYQDIDLILTTIRPSSALSIPSLLVNSVFTKQDAERTKRILGGMNHGSTTNRKFQHS